MREEVLVRLRQTARTCRFDFKAVAAELGVFCRDNGYPLLSEEQCRRAFSDDYSGVSDLPAPPALLPVELPVCAATDAQKETIFSPSKGIRPPPPPPPSSALSTSTDDETSTIDVEEAVINEVDDPMAKTHVPSPDKVGSVSILDLVEHEGFDRMMQEIEEELALRADPKDQEPTELGEVIKFLDAEADSTRRKSLTQEHIARGNV